MRIPSGVTDQYIYFVAVDATDFTTRETGLSSFTVYRSRDGGTATAMTTPTINETSSANMPGVYELLLDEDTTIAAGNDTEEMCLHITATGMAPVTRTIELYRPKITAGNTLDVTATGAGGVDWANVEGATTAVNLTNTTINLCNTTTDVTNQVTADVTAISGDTSAANNLEADYDTTGYAKTNSTIGTVTNVTNQVTANVTAVSGDTAAADNLEADYDGTGYNKSNSTIGTCTTNTDMRGTDSAATAANLATVDANVDDIKLGIILGAAQTGTLSTTQATTDLTGYADDQLISRVIVWTSGAAEGEATDITDYASASGLITFTAITTAPGNGDTFKIV